MAFSSYEFLFLFLPVAIAGSCLLSRVGRSGALGWLIAISVVFHACAGWRSLVVIAISTLLTYAFVRVLLRMDLSKARLRRFLFATGIAADCALLCYFKYQNFFIDTANALFALNWELSTVLLPLGISFLTFQKIALLSDVYSGRITAVNAADYALFTLFFPRAIAGPIVRYDEIVPQFAGLRSRISAADVSVAVCLFSIGLFKKTVIADTLAMFADPVFAIDDPYPRPLLAAWSGALAYTLQLYFDFSGYSDMALGVARLFGVRLPINFNSPLRASSIIEFWGRWHITLTRFLTAYVYTPIVLHLTRARLAKGKPVLGGRRSAPSAIVPLIGIPTLITMTVSGIWHGAGWQFVVWGALHGLFITINQAWRILRPRLWRDQGRYDRVMGPAGWVLTFGSVVVAMVFFRASSVTQALNILTGMLGVNGIAPHDVQLLLGPSMSLIEAVRLSESFEAFVWIAILLAFTLLMPNSLEILRRFEPALDFSEQDANSPIPAPAHSRLEGGRMSRAVYAVREIVERYRRGGVRLTGFVTVLAALLWLLGVMAISGSNAFIYGQF